MLVLGPFGVLMNGAKVGIIAHIVPEADVFLLYLMLFLATNDPFP